jgi:hypothetical protein
MLVAAGLAGGRDHALISLLALNGLRVSEAIGADIEDLGLERGHRTLTILRKGGKVVTVPLAPRTARAIDLAVGERCDGPIFVGPNGRPIDRDAAGRIVRRIARRAGIAKRVGPSVWGRIPSVTRSSPPPSTPACRSATCKRPPATPTPAPPCDTTKRESPSTGTPPISSRHSSPAPAADTDLPALASEIAPERAICTQ